MGPSRQDEAPFLWLSSGECIELKERYILCKCCWNIWCRNMILHFHIVLVQSEMGGWQNPHLLCKWDGAIHTWWSWFSKLQSFQIIWSRVFPDCEGLTGGSCVHMHTEVGWGQRTGVSTGRWRVVEENGRRKLSSQGLWSLILLELLLQPSDQALLKRIKESQHGTLKLPYAAPSGIPLSSGVPHHFSSLRKIYVLFLNILQCCLHSWSSPSASCSAYVPLLSGGFPLVHVSLACGPFLLWVSSLITFSSQQFWPHWFSV